MTWALGVEGKNEKIDVVAWIPSTISTRLTNYKKDFMTVDPDSFAKQALSRCTSVVCGGTLIHELLIFFVKLPMNFVKVKTHPMGMFTGFFGKRALRKRKEELKKVN